MQVSPLLCLWGAFYVLTHLLRWLLAQSGLRRHNIGLICPFEKCVQTDPKWVMLVISRHAVGTKVTQSLSEDDSADVWLSKSSGVHIQNCWVFILLWQLMISDGFPSHHLLPLIFPYEDYISGPTFTTAQCLFSQWSDLDQGDPCAPTSCYNCIHCFGSLVGLSFWLTKPNEPVQVGWVWVIEECQRIKQNRQKHRNTVNWAKGGQVVMENMHTYHTLTNLVLYWSHVCVCACCVQQRNDDEAVVDRRGTRSQQGTNFEKEDLEGTCTDTECIWNATKTFKHREAAAAESAYSVLATAAFLLTACS